MNDKLDDVKPVNTKHKGSRWGWYRRGTVWGDEPSWIVKLDSRVTNAARVTRLSEIHKLELSGFPAYAASFFDRQFHC